MVAAVASKKVPVPEVLQSTPAAFDTKAFSVTGSAVQTIWSLPASMAGRPFTVTVTWSLTGRQAPPVMVVRVSVTLPLARSEALNV